MQTTRDADWDQVWVGAHIATMAGGADPYGSIPNAALAVKGESIAWIGRAEEAMRAASARNIPQHDVRGRWMTPGLIDCHTHLVYGGNRVAEYERRLGGATYEEIARAGGGIQSTVRATRAASADELRVSALRRARRLMSEGVTTIEIKSGYGLDLGAERRMLEVARGLGRELPVSVRTTYLGLHALPEEYRDDRRGFVDAASGPWLEAIAAAGLADAVDAFCESIAFTVGETEQFLAAAKRLGLPSHVHAGQLRDVGAAELAARYGALSADHLECLSAAGAEALARSGTVAVLLPCEYFMLRQTAPPPVALLRAAAVPLAVATDCNPGTSRMHVDPSRARDGVYVIRLDAGRGARRSDAQRRARAGPRCRPGHTRGRQTRGLRAVGYRPARRAMLCIGRKSLCGRRLRRAAAQRIIRTPVTKTALDAAGLGRLDDYPTFVRDEDCCRPWARGTHGAPGAAQEHRDERFVI